MKSIAILQNLKNRSTFNYHNGTFRLLVYPFNNSNDYVAITVREYEVFNCDFLKNNKTV